MHAVLQEAISAYSLPLTIIVGVIGLYWLVALIGVMDFDALDGALGLDGDAGGGEVDVDAGADGDGMDADGDGGDHGDHSGGPGFLSSVLKVMGATDAPLMFVMTVFSLVLWGANVLGNIYFNAGRSSSLATLILVAALVGAFVMTRVLVRPLRPLMRLMRDTEKRIPIVGLTGKVRSLSITEKGGQVEVLRDGATILLHARVAEGRDPLPRGTEVLVVLQDEDEKGAYLVRPLSIQERSDS
ncbi:MAG: hypothetical protein KDL87_16070 [Verrucomicrobiae bacterium]|nr:hypothetical protein [Verrucomicrobiae bacterium]